MVIDARRNLLRFTKEWYPRLLLLHRFMVAISREALHRSSSEGDTLDPLIWDCSYRPKVRRVEDRVIQEFAGLPGPTGFLHSSWVRVDSGPVTANDIAVWPYSVTALIKFTSFLSTLQWPEGLNEMGHHGVSYVELLILFEKWIGNRLLPEKTIPKSRRAGRPLCIGDTPVSDGVKIRTGCQLLGSKLRSLATLPGGLHRFLPCSLGAHLSRLRHVGWLQCSHGLSSRPLETCQAGCLDPLLSLLGYSSGSNASKLAHGELLLRHCIISFAIRFLPWTIGLGSGTAVIVRGHSSSPWWSG